MRPSIAGCCARAATGHATEAPAEECHEFAPLHGPFLEGFGVGVTFNLSARSMQPVTAWPVCRAPMLAPILPFSFCKPMQAPRLANR